MAKPRRVSKDNVAVEGSGMTSTSPVRMMLPSDVYTSCESSVMWAEVKNAEAS